MKLFVMFGERLVPIPKSILRVIEKQTIYVESNFCHIGDHIEKIKKDLNEQRAVYEGFINRDKEGNKTQSVFYYMDNVKFFTDFNGKIIYSD